LKGHNTEWPVFKTAHHIPAHLTLQRSVEVARSWISYCEKSHVFCKAQISPIPPFLPTRVLEISSKVRLLEPKNVRARYITLSHRWGNPLAMLRTTKNTLQTFCEEIPWSFLPQTFCDAIEITKGLDFQYLWIDSLCIIQDDPVDWQSESARMSDVYSFSHLNLAATQVADPNKGLCIDRFRLEGSLR
jgi:hypothetical protein